jgi:hypothetical protein
MAAPMKGERMTALDRIPGLATLAFGRFAILGTRAPCTCTMNHPAVPWTIVKRQAAEDAEPTWHVLDARGETRHQYETLRAALFRHAPAGGPLETWLDRTYPHRIAALDATMPVEHLWTLPDWDSNGFRAFRAAYGRRTHDA